MNCCPVAHPPCPRPAARVADSASTAIAAVPLALSLTLLQRCAAGAAAVPKLLSCFPAGAAAAFVGACWAFARRRLWPGSCRPRRQRCQAALPAALAGRCLWCSVGGPCPGGGGRAAPCRETQLRRLGSGSRRLAAPMLPPSSKALPGRRAIGTGGAAARGCHKRTPLRFQHRCGPPRLHAPKRRLDAGGCLLPRLQLAPRPEPPEGCLHPARRLCPLPPQRRQLPLQLPAGQPSSRLCNLCPCGLRLGIHAAQHQLHPLLCLGWRRRFHLWRPWRWRGRGRRHCGLQWLQPLVQLVEVQLVEAGLFLLLRHFILQAGRVAGPREESSQASRRPSLCCGLCLDPGPSSPCPAPTCSCLSCRFSSACCRRSAATSFASRRSLACLARSRMAARCSSCWMVPSLHAGRA